MNGGYEDGYKACPCFWGCEPGSLVRRLASLIDLRNARVLDAGCGEGKNAAFIAAAGGKVDAVDVSQVAIENGKRVWGHMDAIKWHVSDFQTWLRHSEPYDVVVAYGVLHCLTSRSDLEFAVDALRRATKDGGHHVVCAFNVRHQELIAHPGLRPTLIAHDEFRSMYEHDCIVFESDADITETHPHNGIEHTHSLSRLIVQIRHHYEPLPATT